MQIRLLEIAQIELDDSIEYYNLESDGLGDEFLVEALHIDAFLPCSMTVCQITTIYQSTKK